MAKARAVSISARLESGVRRAEGYDTEICLLSIAISLKRIADMMEEDRDPDTGEDVK